MTGSFTLTGSVAGSMRVPVVDVVARSRSSQYWQEDLPLPLGDLGTDLGALIAEPEEEREAKVR